MKLALGTVQFGQNYGIANQAGQVSPAETKAILELATTHRINMLDTATSYGDSELRLGAIGIPNWQVVSKLPAVPDGCADIASWVTDSAHASLRRLSLQSHYGLLLHRPQQLLDADGDQIFLALQNLKSMGLVQKIGVSIYDPAELDALCPRFEFDMVQAPFNLLDRRMINSGWMNRLANSGTELHVRSIFLQGLLLMPPSERPSKFNRWQKLWSAYSEWLRSDEITPLQACVRYSLSFAEITKVIVGVDAAHQLREIVEAAGGSIPVLPGTLQVQDCDLINPSRWAPI